MPLVRPSLAAFALAALTGPWLATGAAAQTAAPAAAATTSAAAPAGRAGTVKIVTGRVEANGPAGLRSLGAGDAVSAADQVTTGPASSASMVLRDGTTLVVGAGSRMELRNFAYDSTTQDGSLALSLVRGTLRMITGLIGKARPEAVALTTPTATVGIRGTDFIVQVDDAETAVAASAAGGALR